MLAADFDERSERAAMIKAEVAFELASRDDVDDVLLAAVVASVLSFGVNSGVWLPWHVAQGLHEMADQIERQLAEAFSETPVHGHA